VLASCQQAKERGLSVVSGLCLRYGVGFREAIRRIHDGAIGEVIAMMANDYRGPLWVKPRQPEWTDMHWQMRNWYYFTWLSGDFNVEQHVHFLDVCAWVMQDAYPNSAVGMGGRQVRVGEEFGNIFDHHSVTYEYSQGVRLFSNCRQMADCANDMSAIILGTKGQAILTDARKSMGLKTRDGRWIYEYRGNDDVYQTEHDELFASIRNGRPINNGEYMAKSTLLGIQGRMATYTGERIGWEQAAQSQELLGPREYAWGPIAAPAVAQPGITKFV
jgi:predicted dehydrogenase